MDAKHIKRRLLEPLKAHLKEKEISLIVGPRQAGKTHYSEGSTFGDILNFRHGEKLVSIGAYCLMPNHFHLLLREIKEGGISSFMQKLSTGYTMYFNKRNERTGSLFEGRFKAQHADTDEYLKYLFSYIHLNPVKLIDSGWKENGIADLQKTKEYLNEYLYSSYCDFFGKKRKEKVILNTEAFPRYFESQNDFEECLEDWLTYNGEFDVKSGSKQKKRSGGL